MNQDDEGRRQDAPATSQIIYSNYCSDDPGESYPRCECGVRAPSEYHLEKHKRLTGCLGEREYHRLVRPSVRWRP